MRTLAHIIDAINSRVGNYTSLLLIPLIVITTGEVIARYAFNRPSIWAWDVNIQLSAMIIVFGAGYTLLQNAHIRVDVITSHLSQRAQAIIRLVVSPLMFISLGALTWQGISQTKYSISMTETLPTIWEPPIYPLKALIVAGVILFILQAVASVIRDIDSLRSGGKA